MQKDDSLEQYNASNKNQNSNRSNMKSAAGETQKIDANTTAENPISGENDMSKCLGGMNNLFPNNNNNINNNTA